MTRRRAQRAIVAASAVLGLVIEALDPELFASVTVAAVVLLATYAVLRPTLVVGAITWIRARARRTVAVTVVALAVFAIVAFTTDQLRHPSVDAATEAALWNDANAALSRVASADLGWQNAKVAARPAALTAVRIAVSHFAHAVDTLGRVRPPEAGRAAHLSVVPVYRDMANELQGLPVALAEEDANAAASIWQRIGALEDEAAAYARLTSPASR